MIALSRARDADAIHENFVGHKKREFEEELLRERRSLRKGEIEELEFDSDRWKAAKERLIAETRGKCAYCETPTTAVAYGDVEHYRPKSIYWWLAYCYDNYLVSCQLCNQKFKRDAFPIAGSKIRGPRVTKVTTDSYITTRAGSIAPDPTDADQVAEFASLHESEEPLLLNPYYQDPELVFAWQAEDVLQEVELAPADEAAERAFRAAERYYGLNRPQLRSYRYQVYRLYRVLKLALADPGISPATRTEIEAAIESMKAPEAAYSAMIRYFDRT